MEQAEELNGQILPLAAPLQPELVLSLVERQFFQRMARMIADTDQQMRGALQLIIDERGLAGLYGLSEDFSRLVPKQPQ